MLKTAYLYENIFATKTAAELMSQQETRMMKIRDLLLDPKADNDLTEDLIWTNLIESEDVPSNKRITAIRYLDMTLLTLLDMKKNPDNSKKIKRIKRVAFYVDLAVNSLPEVKPFADDLIKISQR